MSAHEQLVELVELGLSDPAIAGRLGVSARTVLRWRKALELPSRWQPTPAPHGTTSRYRSCELGPCADCRAANVAAHSAYVQARNAALPAPNAGKPWTAAELELLRDDTAGTVLVRAERLGRSYGACLQRLHVDRQ
jgi:hypothetical protein